MDGARDPQKALPFFARPWIAVPGGLIGFLLLLWLFSFSNTFPDQDRCSFERVTNASYREFLSQARWQPWTIWPGVSKGLIWPSEQWFGRPVGEQDRIGGATIFESIRSIVPADGSRDQILAAVHAVMRSIGAEYDNWAAIPDSFREARVLHFHFGYMLPQRRFAPLCLTCFLWSETTIRIQIDHDIARGSYALADAVVLHESLESSLKRTRTQVCPSYLINPDIFTRRLRNGSN